MLPLVFLPGAGGRAGFWRPVAERLADSVCVMDLHATLFAISAAGALSTTRMDGEGIPMPSILGNYCQRIDP